MFDQLSPIFMPGTFWVFGNALGRYVVPPDNVAPSLVLDFRNGIYASDTVGSWAQARAQDGVRPSLVLDFVTPQYGSA